MPEHIEPHILQRVFRAVRRGQYLSQKVPQPRRIPLDQLRERRLIPRLGAHDQHALINQFRRIVHAAAIHGAGRVSPPIRLQPRRKSSTDRRNR
jgi:hypothetical protein